MKDLACVYNALNEENIFTNIVFIIQNAELGKLGASRCYIHVRPWSLKTIAVQCWFEGLNDVLPVVLICRNKYSALV